MQTAAYKAGGSVLLSALRILVESAALQLIVEIVLLSLYSSDINAQYIVLESVASVVGITFNAITLRIKLHTFNTPRSLLSGNSSNGVQTIGSVPMRRIQVNITRDVEDQSYDIEPSFDQTK